MEFDQHTIKIQPASRPDAAEILEVQKLAFHGQAVLYNDFTLPPLVQTLEELLGEFERYTYLKALVADRIIGSVRSRAEAGACFISRLIVHPDCQGKGIGTMLMQEIERKFDAAERYVLYTGHKSERNLGLYRKLGYAEFGRTRQSDNVMLINLEKRKAGPSSGI